AGAGCIRPRPTLSDGQTELFHEEPGFLRALGPIFVRRPNRFAPSDELPATRQPPEPCAKYLQEPSAAQRGNVLECHSLDQASRLGAPAIFFRMWRTASLRFSARASGCLGQAELCKSC